MTVTDPVFIFPRVNFADHALGAIIFIESGVEMANDFSWVLSDSAISLYKIHDRHKRQPCNFDVGQSFYPRIFKEQHYYFMLEMRKQQTMATKRQHRFYEQ